MLFRDVPDLSPYPFGRQFDRDAGVDLEANFVTDRCVMAALNHDLGAAGAGGWGVPGKQGDRQRSFAFGRRVLV